MGQWKLFILTWTQSLKKRLLDTEENKNEFAYQVSESSFLIFVSTFLTSDFLFRFRDFLSPDKTLRNSSLSNVLKTWNLRIQIDASFW